MKILLAFDKNLKINKSELVKFIDSKTEYLKFELFKLEIEFDEQYITKPESFNSKWGIFKNELEKYDRVFCFTDKPYDDNYFFHEHKLISIYSFYAWNELTNLPKTNGALYFIIDYLALQVDPTGFRHQNETGCIYDFLWYKDGIDDGMRQAKICPNCLERLNEHLNSEVQFNILKDLKILMNSLSNSSKWNQDILEKPKKNKKIIKKRKPKQDNEINVVIVSPGDTHSERKLLLDSLEIQFRKGNHENHCNQRLIVHGWEDLASQNGYPQDVINEKIISEMDFVIAVFKHKLGTPTIDQETGLERAESGTSEELLQALDYSKEDHPLGMAYFYSKAPVISVDSKDLDKIKSEWKRLDAFKKKIRDKMIYKPFTESGELLQTVLNDLEKNIIDYFE
jgi:hypothetical protein